VSAVPAEGPQARDRDPRPESGRQDRPVSLLHPAGHQPSPPGGGTKPDYFDDLNLDQFVDEVIARSTHPEQTGALLYSPLADTDIIRFRQGVFGDLAEPVLRERARHVVRLLSNVRRRLHSLVETEDPHERQGWLLDAAATYCEAVDSLGDALRSGGVRSQGLTLLSETLSRYRHSGPYTDLASEVSARQEALGRIRYCVRISGRKVQVSRYDGQADYSQEVEEVFHRFQQGAASDYWVNYRLPPALGRVGSQILTQVATLHPDEFESLALFCERHHDFACEQMMLLEGELDFYLSYLDNVDPLVSAGLPFCYPTIADAGTDEEVVQTFDIALASKLIGAGQSVVLNDFRLEGAERIFVVTGPNQGGKTTFGRTFGQLHHLASLGCPVPGESATLGRQDRIFTHFQRDEGSAEPRGRLEDDLRRIRHILEKATSHSVIVINEAFASTTLDDGRFLGTAILHRLIALGARGVYVTFVDELASIGPQVVSVVSTVADDDAARRTFKIVRAPANGLAYAVALAEKYDLTYEQLKRTLER
jgi:DNA mismatch repair protein MutS